MDLKTYFVTRGYKLDFRILVMSKALLEGLKVPSLRHTLQVFKQPRVRMSLIAIRETTPEFSGRNSHSESSRIKTVDVANYLRLTASKSDRSR